jgi:hypothetical protein
MIPEQVFACNKSKNSWVISSFGPCKLLLPIQFTCPGGELQHTERIASTNIDYEEPKQKAKAAFRPDLAYMGLFASISIDQYQRSVIRKKAYTALYSYSRYLD